MQHHSRWFRTGMALSVIALIPWVFGPDLLNRANAQTRSQDWDSLWILHGQSKSGKTAVQIVAEFWFWMTGTNWEHEFCLFSFEQFSPNSWKVSAIAFQDEDDQTGQTVGTATFTPSAWHELLHQTLTECDDEANKCVEANGVMSVIGGSCHLANGNERYMAAFVNAITVTNVDDPTETASLATFFPSYRAVDAAEAAMIATDVYYAYHGFSGGGIAAASPVTECNADDYVFHYDCNDDPVDCPCDPSDCRCECSKAYARDRANSNDTFIDQIIICVGTALVIVAGCALGCSFGGPLAVPCFIKCLKFTGAAGGVCYTTAHVAWVLRDIQAHTDYCECISRNCG